MAGTHEAYLGHSLTAVTTVNKEVQLTKQTDGQNDPCHLIVDRSKWTEIVHLPLYKPEIMHMLSVSVHDDSVQRCMLIQRYADIG